jgi:anti-sigma factor RsiW
MSCRTIHELLEQARDESLPPLVRTAVDAHLAACADCARLAVLEREMAGGLASVRDADAELEIPADFRRRVKERLLASNRAVELRPSRLAWQLPAGLAAAACLCLAVVAGIALRGAAPPEGEAVAVVAPAPILDASSAMPVRADLQTPRSTLDLRTAPLLYATPEVEVFYGGPAEHDSDEEPRVVSSPVGSPDDEERPKQRREYHF